MLRKEVPITHSFRFQLLSFMSFAHFNHHLQHYAFPAVLFLITQEIPLNYLEIGLLGSLPVLIMALFSPLVGYFGCPFLWS